MTIEEILIEAERRRKMFHWFINGIYQHGISWEMYKCLTPDLISGLYNITF